MITEKSSPAPRLAAVGLLAAVPSSLVAVALAAPALVDAPAGRWAVTAAALAVAAVAVVAGSVVGGLAGRRSPASFAMLGGALGLVLAGLPVFVALEPVWWRFAAGMAGPLLVGAALAYGVRDALRPGHRKPWAAARAWLKAPLELLRSLAWSLLGRDDLPHSQRP